MENQENNSQQAPQQPAPQPPAVVKPAAAQPIPQPTPQPPVQPVPPTQTQKPLQQVAAATKPVAQKKPVAALPKNSDKSNKKVVIGCVSAFGCSILLFVGVLFAFLAFGSAENPIFGFFGVPAGEVVNALITLVNLIFLILVFTAFIFVVIGIFKITTAKKEDKQAKSRGMTFTLVALIAFVFLIFIWVFAYFFLASKRTPVVLSPIITEPVQTVNLTAPVTIKFDASKAPINTRQFEILSYDWDFADGTELSGNPQTHTFSDIGNYKVKLVITVKEKAAGTEQEVEFFHDVTIQNVLANVVIKASDLKGPAPLAVSLDGSDSSSPNGEITGFSWDLDEDGNYDDGDESTAQITFTKLGKHTVSLRVQDSTGEFSIGNLEIEATLPDTPVAVISIESVDGKEGLDFVSMEINQAILFSGAESTSPNGTIDKYEWEFGDSEKASTRSATHAYKNPGQYDVMLRVTDSDGKKGETVQRLTIGTPAGAPLASIKTTPEAKNNVVSGQAPLNVIFDATGSQDPNNNIVDYAWDFNGDGKTDDTSALTSHVFNTAGNHNVSLTVTDSTNLSGTKQVVIAAAAAGLKADISANPVAGTAPLTVEFDASGSSYSDGRIVSYEWDFGDGGEPRIDASSVAHQYTTIGTFTAKVTAIASDGERAVAEVPVNVRPVSVNACFEPSISSGNAPLEVKFDPTCSTGTVVNYRWNFASLGRSTERKPTYTFENPGEYEVTLEVADIQNVIDRFTDNITVEAPTR